MASAINRIDNRSATQRLSELINNLSIDEVRILTRLLNNWEKRDQRRHPRTPCSIITQYIVGDQAHKDIIRNISPGGAFIESGHLFPANLEISQSFFFPNFEIPIRSKSKIIWTGPNGFGVQFNILEHEK